MEKYKIAKLIDAHNHRTSKGEFKHYTTTRKLNDTQRDDIKALIDLHVETKNIKHSFVKKKQVKRCIRNISQALNRHMYAKKREG